MEPLQDWYDVRPGAATALGEPPSSPTRRRAGRILVVTRHFPPSRGGVQSFAYEFTRRLATASATASTAAGPTANASDAAGVVVLAPDEPGAAGFDAQQSFPVQRYRTSLLTDPRTPHRLARLVREHDITSVWLTAAAPMVALAPALRKAGAQRIVASSHGQEIAWARLPVTRPIATSLARSVDAITYLGAYTHEHLQPALSTTTELVHLPGGVDASRFRPHTGGSMVRLRHRLGARPVVVSMSRLVTRKGHDRLIEAWPAVLAAVPDAILLIVGDGRCRARLEEQARDTCPRESVLFAGEVEARELPAYLDAADVFALPVRDRWAGLEVEGLGLAILEASAAGLPVVVGRSGGTPDAVLDGVTGHLVDGRDPRSIAGPIVDLLLDPAKARAMGRRGREWVLSRWTWEAVAERLRAALHP